MVGKNGKDQNVKGGKGKGKRGKIQEVRVGKR